MKRVVMWSTVLLLCLVLLSGCSKKNEGSSSSVSEGSDSSLSSANVSATPVMVKAAVVKGAASGLYVRSTASLDGEKLAIVDNGATFRLMAEEPDGDWYQISYNGTTAYLNKEYVEIKEITEDEMSALESSAETTNSSTASSDSSDSSASSSESSASSSSESSDPEINTADKQDVEN